MVFLVRHYTLLALTCWETNLQEIPTIRADIANLEVDVHVDHFVKRKEVILRTARFDLNRVPLEGQPPRARAW